MSFLNPVGVTLFYQSPAQKHTNPEGVTYFRVLRKINLLIQSL